MRRPRARGKGSETAIPSARASDFRGAEAARGAARRRSGRRTPSRVNWSFVIACSQPASPASSLESPASSPHASSSLSVYGSANCQRAATVWLRQSSASSSARL